MPERMVEGDTSALTAEDERKRAIVADLVSSENKVLLDFAKLLITASFSAIAVTLTLKDKWIPQSASVQQRLLVGTAIAMFLIGGLLGSLAARVYQHRVTLSDFDDVDNELHRVARSRYRLTRIGFGFFVVAMIVITVVVLSS